MDKEILEREYLFFVVPNNSGGSMLYHLIGKCDEAITLDNDEGQAYIRDLKNKDGEWASPFSFDKSIAPRFFSAGKHHLTNPDNYDWEAILKQWNSIWEKEGDLDSNLLVEKSPPSVYWVEQLFDLFPNSKFLFMTRSPYAIVEGMARRHNYEPRFAVSHWIQVSNKMLELMEQLDDDRYVYITYEEMCDSKDEAEEAIKSLSPKLKDFSLRKTHPEASLEGDRITRQPTNLNEKQISRLPPVVIDAIGNMIHKHFGDEKMQELRQQYIILKDTKRME